MSKESLLDENSHFSSKKTFQKDYEQTQIQIQEDSSRKRGANIT